MTDRTRKAAENRFMEIVWLSSARGAKAGGELINWTLGGAAASFALAVSTLKDGDAHVHDFELHLTMLLLVCSLAVGGISKFYGIISSASGESLQLIHDWLRTEEGKAVMLNLPEDTKHLDPIILAPYKWPVSWMLRRALRKKRDPFFVLAANVSLQSRWSIFHLLLLFAAGITFVIGLK